MTLPDRIMAAILMLLFLAGFGVRVESVEHAHAPTADEMRYSQMIDTERSSGTTGLRTMAAMYHGGPYADFGLPSPDRVGYIYLRAWSDRLFGMEEPAGGRWLSTLADEAALVLLGVGLWSLAGPVQAVAASALYASSPLVLVMARHGWQESVVGLMGVAMLLAAAGALRGQVSGAGALGLLTGIGLTMKSTLFVSGLMLCVIVLLGLRHRKLHRCSAALAAGLLLSSMLAVVWLSVTLGGVGQILYFVRGERQQATAYCVAYQTASAADWIYVVARTEPFVFCLASLSSVLLVRQWPRRREVEITLPLLAVAVAALALAVPLTGEHAKNLRFSALAFAPICILAGESVARCCALISPRLKEGRRPWVFAVAAVYLILAAGAGVWQFRAEFEQPDVMDLAVRNLL